MKAYKIGTDLDADGVVIHAGSIVLVDDDVEMDELDEQVQDGASISIAASRIEPAG